MKNITLSFLLWLISYNLYSQCINDTENSSVMSTNSGLIQAIADNVDLQNPTEYVTVTDLIIGHDYQFISTRTGNDDFITVTDQSDTPLTNGFGTSPWTINNIQETTVRIHVRVDAACNTDNYFHNVTIQDLTNAPSACFEPDRSSVRADYLSNTTVDFHWSAPSMGTPVDYDWEIVLQNQPLGTGFSGSSGGATNASSGPVLAAGTWYDLYIRSNCGGGSTSVWIDKIPFRTAVADPPLNDLCSGAELVLEQTGIPDAGSATPTHGTVDGGAETDVDAETCNSKTGNARDDVWFKFIAQTQYANITLENNTFDGVITLYSGDCGSLAYIGCSDITNSSSSEEINVNSGPGLTIGNTYYVRVYNYGSYAPSNSTFDLIIWSTTAATDNDNDGYVASVDCNDNDANEFPGQIWYLDADADGYSNGTSTVACARPTYYYTSAELTLTSGDCNDGNNTVYPGALEIWYDSIDENCDGQSDYDQDGDGYDSDSYGGTDCNDTDPSINPAAPEIWYDGIDENCDGQSDYDQDGDGYDSDSYGGTDCNDIDPSINPEASEIWYDGIDENCDGKSDYDQDGDGYDSDSYGGTDCDDTDPNVNPGATEIVGNGIDDDCDGLIDETLAVDELNLNKIKISPNPFNQSINIVLPQGYEYDSFNIQLFDLNGRVIFQKTLLSSNGKINIDSLNALQQGFYLIKLTNNTENRSVVRQVIKY